MLMKLGFSRLAVIGDMWQLIQAGAMLAGDFPETLTDLEAVGADLIGLAGGLSVTALEKLLNDATELYKDAMSEYQNGTADAVAKLLDAWRKLIADAKG